MDSSTQGLTWECYRVPGISIRGEWRRLIENHLESEQTPYSFDVQGQTLRVWDSRARAKTIHRSTHTYRDAYQLRRVDFGGSQNDTLIGISIGRVFFEQGVETPSKLSQNELFQKGRYPPSLRHMPMLAGISDLIACLKRASELQSLAQHRAYTTTELHNQIIYHTSNGRRSLQSLSGGEGFSKNLLHLVQDNLAIQPTAIRLGVLNKLATDGRKAHNIASYVLDVLRGWGCEAIGVALDNDAAVKNFVADKGRENIVLVPLDGKGGDRPSRHAIGLLKYLDSEHVPFQLCSTASNPLYSRHGLALSILQKAGGTHFSTHPNRFESVQDSWFIGLDLGRGGQREGRIAVITLTDSKGILKGYWRALKDKKESLPLVVLARGLGWIVEQTARHEPSRKLVVIRDGICPKDENIQHYTTAMGQHPFTLIEYVKTGTPLIHVDGAEPNPGTLLIPESTQFAAMYACLDAKPNVLTNPVKFRVRLNPSQLSQQEVGQTLLALCHSATLSYQPSRIPAPVQWANGLAKLKWTDLQYAGWSHLPNHTVDLRK